MAAAITLGMLGFPACFDKTDFLGIALGFPSERGELVVFDQKRIAVFLEALIMLVAVSQTLLRLPTDGAGLSLPMRLVVTTATNTLQVLWHIVQMVAIFVMDILRPGLPTPTAWPWWANLAGVIMRSRPTSLW